MDMVTGIAAASVANSTAKLKMDVSLSVTKKAMDNQEMAAQQLMEMLPSVQGTGQHMDVRA